jgi:hypothetical protein
MCEGRHRRCLCRRIRSRKVPRCLTHRVGYKTDAATQSMPGGKEEKSETTQQLTESVPHNIDNARPRTFAAALFDGARRADPSACGIAVHPHLFASSVVPRLLKNFLRRPCEIAPHDEESSTRAPRVRFAFHTASHPAPHLPPTTLSVQLQIERRCLRLCSASSFCSRPSR